MSEQNKSANMKNKRGYVKECCVRIWGVTDVWLKHGPSYEIKIHFQMQSSRNEYKKNVKKPKYRKYMKYYCMKYSSKVKERLEIAWSYKICDDCQMQDWMCENEKKNKS